MKKILGLSLLPDQALGASLWRARLEKPGLLRQNFWPSAPGLRAFLWELQPRPFRAKFSQRLGLGPWAGVTLSQVRWWCFLRASLAPGLAARNFGREILCFQGLPGFCQSLLILGVLILWKSSWSLLDQAKGRQLRVWEKDFFELRASSGLGQKGPVPTRFGRNGPAFGWPSATYNPAFKDGTRIAGPGPGNVPGSQVCARLRENPGLEKTLF